MEERTKITLLKKVCVDCGYLISWKDDIENKKCKDDPECPASKMKFTYGRNPEVIAKRLATLMLMGDNAPVKEKKKMDGIMANRKDSFAIMERAVILKAEMEKEQRTQQVPVLGTPEMKHDEEDYEG